jgi:hypothetical protein
MASILLVLSLSANTAFADFPRLCRMVAEDGYLPAPLAIRGRRLVYTVGILLLLLLCGALLVAFGGVTDRLIPLYAIGAFLAFTLSQSGMVMHWRRQGGSGSQLAMYVNGLGAIATATTVLVVTFTKFTSGAWITTLVIPAIILLMLSVRRHYDRVADEVTSCEPMDLSNSGVPIVVVPMVQWNKIMNRALQFAFNLSSEVHAVHVDSGDGCDELRREWARLVKEPCQRAALQVPHLTVVKSPYRFVINPIVDYVLNLEQRNPRRLIAVIIPELVEKHWYLYILHNQRATWLKAALLLKRSQRNVVVNVPWYLDT